MAVTLLIGTYAGVGGDGDDGVGLQGQTSWRGRDCGERRTILRAARIAFRSGAYVRSTGAERSRRGAERFLPFRGPDIRPASIDKADKVEVVNGYRYEHRRGDTGVTTGLATRFCGFSGALLRVLRVFAQNLRESAERCPWCCRDGSFCSISGVGRVGQLYTGCPVEWGCS